MRNLTLPAALLAAIAGPYLWNHPEVWTQLKQKLVGTPTASVPAPGGGWSFSSLFKSSPPAREVTATGEYLIPNSDAPKASVEGPRVTDMAEVIRFDVSPAWVTQRWGRVTTVSTEPGLQGLRVTLVTGTQVDDLAGSLTYEFDSYHRVQRIKFEGTTGDPQRLVDHASRCCGLKAEPTRAAALFAKRSGGRVQSALRIEHAPLMRAEAPHVRLRVTMELSNPKSSGQVSAEFREWLAQDRMLRAN